MKTIIEEFLEDYNQVNTAQMNLVLFMDAIQHVCRVSRIIRQPLGNALLLGMGGSGRQSLSRLAAHMYLSIFILSTHISFPLLLSNTKLIFAKYNKTLKLDISIQGRL